jgi:hypothetical protein
VIVKRILPFFKMFFRSKAFSASGSPKLTNTPALNVQSFAVETFSPVCRVFPLIHSYFLNIFQFRSIKETVLPPMLKLLPHKRLHLFD